MLNEARIKLGTKYTEYPALFLTFALFSFLTITTILATILTKGEFFYDIIDLNPSSYVFGDHFDSVMYSSDKPYSKWNVIYPPLITGVYAFIEWITIPYANGTGDNLARILSTSDSSIVVFVIFISVGICALHIVSQQIMLKKYPILSVELLFLFILLSLPALYSIQRGNCIFYAIVFMILFLIGYRSDNKCIRYSAYLCLAIATGIKLYPALLAILILRERKIKEFLFCVTLVASMFLVSFLFTDGDPISFLDNLFSFSSPHDTSRSRIGIREWFAAFGLYFFDDNLNYIGLPVTLFFLAASLILIVVDRKMPLWQAITLLGCNMAIGVGVSTTYGFLYLLPGFIFFISQYDKWDRSTQIITVLFALIFALIPSMPMIKSFCTFGIMLIILYSSFKCIRESRSPQANQPAAPQA